jgi:hypothetical protein
MERALRSLRSFACPLALSTRARSFLFQGELLLQGVHDSVPVVLLETG